MKASAKDLDSSTVGRTNVTMEQESYDAWWKRKSQSLWPSRAQRSKDDSDPTAFPVRSRPGRQDKRNIENGLHLIEHTHTHTHTHTLDHGMIFGAGQVASAVITARWQRTSAPCYN